MVKTRLLISGMRSNACREQVGDALSGVDGVEDVTVSLVRSTAVVMHHRGCEGSALVRAVAALGFAATVESTEI